MKRLVCKHENEIHLSDILKRIDYIIICDDLERSPYQISASEDLSDRFDDDDYTNEQFYVTLTDDQLAQIAPEEIHTFTNIELLGRIAKLDVNKLSKQQQQLLKAEYSKKVVLDKSDVENLIDMLRKCNSISFDGHHLKTLRFLKGEDGKIRSKDCLDIIHQLTIEDYVAHSRSYNRNHIGNNLVIFEPEVEWETVDGTIIEDLKIYVKLDIDETDGHAVALVSMHQAEHADDYPYRN